MIQIHLQSVTEISYPLLSNNCNSSSSSLKTKNISNSISTLSYEKKSEHINMESIKTNEEKIIDNQNNIVFQTFEDPGQWPHSLSMRERDIIIEKGPNEITDYDFPIKTSDSEEKRKFTIQHYNRILCNGKKVKRRWLVY